MRMRARLALLRECWAMLVAVTSICTVAQARVTVRQSDHRVMLENDQVSFVYDLARGQYTAIDKRDHSSGIKDGIFQIHDFTSNGRALTHTWQSQDVLDELGHGKSITITSSSPGQCDLLFEVTLYD
ncbi:MAG: hypothetical protein GY809_17770, partial [Planctomycetes bacterium]|nr:hypothetical protein [Planctomycetota bacterium]